MQSAVAESWGVPTNAGAYDPLLASLVHVTGLLGRPWSAEALSAGLPVPETGLTPELFVRAAARAGLDCAGDRAAACRHFVARAAGGVAAQ